MTPRLRRAIALVLVAWALAIFFASWALEIDMALELAARRSPVFTSKVWAVLHWKQDVREALLEWLRRDYVF